MTDHRKPYRVLFVCMGNICRSPAAEIVFRKLVHDEGLDDRIEIQGTKDSYEIRVDGFSSNPSKQPRIPNYLFFGDDARGVNLSAVTGNSARTSVTVTPLLEILNQRRNRLIHRASAITVILVEFGMLIPIRMRHLHKSYAGF